MTEPAPFCLNQHRTGNEAIDDIEMMYMVESRTFQDDAWRMKTFAKELKLKYAGALLAEIEVLDLHLPSCSIVHQLTNWTSSKGTIVGFVMFSKAGKKKAEISNIAVVEHYRHMVSERELV